MLLYPPEGGSVTFEEMNAAALEAIQNPKNYPTEYTSGMASVMREVYRGRIFAFAFVTRHLEKQSIFGGAISRTGVVLVHKDHIKNYPWNQVESLNLHATYQNHGQNLPQYTGWYYEISFKFRDGSYFTFDPDQTRFPDIPQDRRTRSNHKDTADMCAMYYNRVQSESMQKMLVKGNKRVNIHHDLDQNYAAEIIRRFHSPEGILLKWMRQRVYEFIEF